MREKVEQRELRCALMPDEVAALAMRSARLVGQAVRLRSDKKEVMRHFTVEIESREKEVTDISQAIDSGHIDRKVEVRTMYDSPLIGQKTEVRLDTGEVVATLYMTEAERQYSLPGTPSDPAPEPEPATPPTDASASFDDKEKCPICNGVGTMMEGSLICPTCKGTGQKRLD